MHTRTGELDWQDPVTPIPKKQRDLLRIRSQGVCELCGVKPATNWHHRKNRSQGGPHDLSNALHLCGSGTTGCHGMVTERPLHAFDNGWSVRSRFLPADVIVNYRQTQWVWLDDLGYVIPTEPVIA
jgi:hypothetical protein